MKTLKLVIVAGCVLSLLSCKKNTQDVIIHYHGSIYSAADSLPLANKTVDIFTVASEGLPSKKYIDYLQQFTTDNQGHFEVDFNMHDHYKMGLKWPDVTDYASAFYTTTEAGFYSANRDSLGRIYTLP